MSSTTRSNAGPNTVKTETPQSLNAPTKTKKTSVKIEVPSRSKVTTKKTSEASGSTRKKVVKCEPADKKIKTEAGASVVQRKKSITVKKEPTPKVPKEKKTRVSKKKPAFTLPPEASLYLDQSMRGRVVRAMKQKMFVISREADARDNSIEKFEVLGSVGNNYTVVMGPSIKCSCMDFALRRVHCKHILMVLLKVYRLPIDNLMFRTLSPNKALRLESRSYRRTVDPSILVPEEIRQKILSIGYQNHPDAKPIVPENTATRRSLDTSDCPICFEEFEQEAITTIDFCKTCGNNVHNECFKMWASTKGSNVTCVYCRNKWVVEKPAASGFHKNSVRQLNSSHVNEKYYANFAQELGISRKRDLSMYRKDY
ncbi:hypothetical protein INT48_008878 [Thamnidium elegans]|uniref:Uncharacterized protein n=1 Tax=Thamnidium elegans TaxID=101142 RepID=A0A8H7SNC2_9FUNG|nr:hypothetical protein INT48_008878 [Thamnidium elegans]